MALIRCSECGRAVSDKASACIGCGAPLSNLPGFTWLPKQSKDPRPTRGRLVGGAIGSVLALGLGVAWSSLQRPGTDHVAATLAALLVIGGLCGLIVVALQIYSAARHSRSPHG